MPTPSASWGKDTIERVLSTVVELVLGAATAAFIQKLGGSETVTLDSVFQALTAAATAGYAVVKAYLARLVQNAISPASLAPADTP